MEQAQAPVNNEGELGEAAQVQGEGQAQVQGEGQAQVQGEGQGQAQGEGQGVENAGNNDPQEEEVDLSVEANERGRKRKAAVPVDPRGPAGPPENTESLYGPRFSKVLKVTVLEPAKDETAKFTIGSTVATISIESLPNNPTLAAVRQHAAIQNSGLVDAHGKQSFCYSDGSAAGDGTYLVRYLNHEDEKDVTLHSQPQKAPQPAPEGGNEGQQEQKKPEEPKPLITRTLYIMLGKSKPKTVLSSLLEGKSFSIKIIRWDAGDNGSGTFVSRGTLLAKDLGEADPKTINLAALRIILSKNEIMSAYPSKHKFCTPTGVTVGKEETTFSEYLDIEESEVTKDTKIPAVTLYYKRPTSDNEPWKKPETDLTSGIGPYKEGGSKLTKSEEFFKGHKTADAFNKAASERAFKDDLINIDPTALSNLKFHAASTLDEQQWKQVITNCGLMYGWVVDKANNRIQQARKPAFQLRVKETRTIEELTPNFLKKPSKPKQSLPHTGINKKLPAGSIDDIVELSSKQNDERSREQAKREMDDSDRTAIGPNAYQPNSPEKAAEKKGATESAPAKTQLENVPILAIPKFQVSDNSRVEVTVSSHEFETSMAKNDFSSQTTEGSLSAGWGGYALKVGGGQSSSKSDAAKRTQNTYQKTLIASYLFPRADIILDPEDIEPTPELKLAIQRIAKTKSIVDMRYLISEFGHLFSARLTIGGRLQTTRIMNETSNISDQEQKEQLKNSFSVQVTTPYGGGGVKHEDETGKINQSNTAQKDKSERHVCEAVGGNTILASSPLVWALSVADPGNWRVINRDALSSMVDFIAQIPGYSSVKELFIQAVPTLSRYVDLGGMKEAKVRLRLAGNTTRLSKAYVKRVPKSKVEPDAKALEDTKESAPDAKTSEEAKKGTPDAKATDQAKQSTTTDKTPKDTKPKDTSPPASFLYSDDPLYYLGHIPETTIEPKMMVIKNMATDVWGEIIPGGNGKPLFSPARYRAPAILGYGGEDTDKLMEYNQEFMNTVWNIVAPFDETLSHGARVTLQTVPLEGTIEIPNPAKKAKPTTKVASEDKPAKPNAPSALGGNLDNIKLAEAPNGPATVEEIPDTIAVQASTSTPSSLAVFRNRQGVFLPAMTGSDELHYWRIAKVGAKRVGEKIQEGDQIRLCWLFKDQCTGFRDFSEDVFGRRRTQKPDDFDGEALFFKLPWPRFEQLQTADGEGTGINAMVLSSHPTMDVYWGEICNLPQLEQDGKGNGKTWYIHQDVSFFIDKVANNGRGDVDDGLVPTKEEKAKAEKNRKKTKQELLQEAASMGAEAKKLQQQQMQKLFEALLWLGQ
ncbi:hypothetical protein BU24DRAFT_463141 [Aaosphaeria arxii CBS 175.79]|uniref:MACPF-like domain-containing protein n=1 Tax=Aaosphaeria arxii CBS 175.79 TaxID=1450172 RepID=A0A6A5XPS5_9PLEO|nr:uncharacterized protein BU24DRAFT_463141 [Aaosphaeria arxii CBS 175.79]KAF2014344.1 hypothetical protein BU24DRAFT_463141 [Aaosphaeria arxii CBS 175.79]